MGTVVLPVAVITVFLSVILTIYAFVKAIIKIKDELFHLNSVNFQFENVYEFNLFVLQTLFIRIFSNKIFLLSLLFFTLVWFYLAFAKKQVQFKEKFKINFIVFIFLYSLLFAFWWVVSSVYILFNRKVKWRDETK